MRKKLVAAASQSYSSEATHRSRCDGISAAKRESSIAGVSDLLPLLFCILVCGASLGHAAQVPVQHKEGLIHGFLTLRNHGGEIIANGDLIQNAHGLSMDLSLTRSKNFSDRNPLLAR